MFFFSRLDIRSSFLFLLTFLHKLKKTIMRQREQISSGNSIKLKQRIGSAWSSARVRLFYEIIQLGKLCLHAQNTLSLSDERNVLMRKLCSSTCVVEGICCVILGSSNTEVCKNLCWGFFFWILLCCVLLHFSLSQNCIAERLQILLKTLIRL